MKNANKKGLSIIEYVVMFVIIIMAFLIMRNYLQNGNFGMWGKSGQSFGFGRQYDPQRSVECDYDQTSGQWYDHYCVTSTAASSCATGDLACTESVITSGSCAASYCSTINGTGV